MDLSTHSVLGLVELADAADLFDIHGSAAHTMMHDAFQDRMKHWIRAKDEWRLLDNNRLCVILRDVNSRGELELAAAKLARIFEEPQYHYGKPMPMEVRAGFTKYNESGADMALAMRQAGIALRQARKSARLFDIYTPHSEKGGNPEQDLVKQLEAAVGNGELELYFQPKIHAGYRTLTGAEALMRWNSKEQKSVTTEQFITVAERHDVIRPMTWWALKSAVARLARWPSELSISVNIPPTLLQDDEILTVVGDSLDIHCVDPARLTLEVTESIMADNQKLMVNQLVQLWDLGIKISLDDFGTGFCSLAYFRDMPVDEIKIDKSFVMNMLNSERDLAIVKAVIDLAHNFSLRVVAEGVESKEIARRLAELRCDVLQGYYFDRPLRIGEFEKIYDLTSPKPLAGQAKSTLRKSLV